MHSDDELEEKCPKTPQGLRRTGQTWLLDIKDYKKYVRECPESRQDQLWMKVREGVEIALAEEELEPAASDQLQRCCSLLLSYPDQKGWSEANRSQQDVTACASVLHERLLTMYEYPEAQAAVADVLAMLLSKDCVPAATAVVNTLMWSVYQCTLPTANDKDMARLLSVSRFFSVISWKDPGAKVFVDYVLDLVCPHTLSLAHASGVMASLFAQNAFLTRTLHRKYCTLAAKPKLSVGQSSQLVYARSLAAVWEELDGLSLAVFEHEAVAPYVGLAIKANTSFFGMLRGVLQQLRDGGGRRAKAGLKRLFAESDVLAGLDASNALMRKNCVFLVGDHFPVGNAQGKADFESACTEQLQLLYRALHDPCPIVRAAAVNAICAAVKRSWATVSKQQVLPYLDVIFTKLAYDRTDANVRLATLQGLRTLYQEPTTHELLKKFIGPLKHLNDPNTKVRQLFVATLLDMAGNPFFNLTELASDEVVIKRLSVEKKKPVIDCLVKLLRAGVWFPSDLKKHNKGAPVSDQEVVANGRKLLAIVTKYPSAAVVLYPTLAASSPMSHAMLFGKLMDGVFTWLLHGKTAKTQKQVENTLLVIQTTTASLAHFFRTPQRAGSDKRVRPWTKTQREAFEVLKDTFLAASLRAVEKAFPSPAVTHVVTQIKAVLCDIERSSAEANGTGNTAEWDALERDAGAAGAAAPDDEGLTVFDANGERKEALPSSATATLRLLAARNIAGETAPSWKLLVSRVLAEGMAAELVQLSCTWMRDDDTLESGVLLATEILHDARGRETVLTVSVWRTIMSLLIDEVKDACKAMRGSAVRSFDNDACRALGNKIELLSRVAIHAECMKAAMKDAEGASAKRRKVNPPKAPTASQGDGAAPEASQAYAGLGTEDEVKKVAKILMTSAVPAARKARSAGGVLPAVVVAEQTLAFLKHAVVCFVLAKRGQPDDVLHAENTAAFLDTVLAIDPHLLPRVFEFIATAVEMQVSDLLFTDLLAYVIEKIRNAVVQCDEVKVVSEDLCFESDVEHAKDQAWKHLADHGVFKKSVDRLFVALSRGNNGKRLRDMVEHLWYLGCGTGGFSVLPFVTAELCIRHNPIFQMLLELVLKHLGRGHATGREPTRDEVSHIAMVFAAILAAKSRPATVRLDTFRTAHLNPFLRAHSVFTAQSIVGSQTDADLLEAITPSPSTMSLLTDYLDRMDWTIPLGGQLRVASSQPSAAGDKQRAKAPPASQASSVSGKKDARRGRKRAISDVGPASGDPELTSEIEA